MSIKDIIVTPEAEKGFYPTPRELGAELLSGIDWNMVRTVLEPSAGKGNLIGCIAEKCRISFSDSVEVDAVEIDPYLRSVLKYEFGEERENAVRNRLRELHAKQNYNCMTQRRGELTDDEKSEEMYLENLSRELSRVDVRVVHDDFLTFDTMKHYDLIVMNPPFANGDEHLLKAIRMQEESGGIIRCLLNAETLLNPFTNRRKILQEKLSALGAEITYKSGAFANGL